MDLASVAFRIPYLMEGNDFAVGSPDRPGLDPATGLEPLLILSSADEDMHHSPVTTSNLLQLHS